MAAVVEDDDRVSVGLFDQVFFEAGYDPVVGGLFIEQNPEMLDSKIMMTHYSAETLFSDEVRVKFVEPDLDPIPRYDE